MKLGLGGGGGSSKYSIEVPHCATCHLGNSAKVALQSKLAYPHPTPTNKRDFPAATLSFPSSPITGPRWMWMLTRWISNNNWRGGTALAAALIKAPPPPLPLPPPYDPPNLSPSSRRIAPPTSINLFWMVSGDVLCSDSSSLAFNSEQNIARITQTFFPPYFHVADFPLHLPLTGWDPLKWSVYVIIYLLESVPRGLINIGIKSCIWAGICRVISIV